MLIILICGDTFMGVNLCEYLSNYTFKVCAVYCMSIIAQ